jgi:hypothetical protein
VVQLAVSVFVQTWPNTRCCKGYGVILCILFLNRSWRVVNLSQIGLASVSSAQ